ncbi:MAG: response regulator transcription factor [Verrucomicrobia bacterium]|nr:response regulator transcription factor [Verrucomicrobiota bacterium]
MKPSKGPRLPPAAAKELRRPKPAGKAPVSAIARRKKLLLVDDHPMMRAGLAGLINSQADLEACCETGTVAEALAEIPKCSPDLVVTDLTLPGRGGLELIKDVKALHPAVPVLVISMHDEMLHAERALRAGARGYLMKEAGAEKMLEAIRRVLSGQVYVSERMSAKIFDIFSGRRSHNSPIEKLTDREFEVFQLIGQGKTTRSIAQQLNLSSKTVDVHRGHIKEKLELPDVTSLVRHAVRWVETQNADAP